MKIDLNCDMGESFGRYTLGNDETIMPFITSANIACGLHAGDPSVMRQTVRLAKQHGSCCWCTSWLARFAGIWSARDVVLPDEVEAFVLYQIGALAAFAKAEDVELHHVKPHGALYNQAAKDRNLAKAIAGAVKRIQRRFNFGWAGRLRLDRSGSRSWATRR